MPGLSGVAADNMQLVSCEVGRGELALLPLLVLSNTCL